MSHNEIVATVTELQELKRMREELDAEMDTLTDKIKAHMGETVELTAGAFKITWKPVTSSRFDSTAFKKDFPDVAAEYTRQTVARRFVIA